MSYIKNMKISVGWPWYISFLLFFKKPIYKKTKYLVDVNKCFKYKILFGKIYLLKSYPLPPEAHIMCRCTTKPMEEA